MADNHTSPDSGNHWQSQVHHHIANLMVWERIAQRYMRARTLTSLKAAHLYAEEEIKKIKTEPPRREEN